MTIRPFHPADTPALLAVLDPLIPEFFAPEEKPDFEAYLTHHLEAYFVVETDGEVVAGGGLNFFPRDHLARISWDLVHPRHRGKGVGRALLDFRIAHARSLAVPKLVVRTSQLAWGFYEKSGFELLYVLPDYWAPGFDLYCMEMPL